MQTFLPYADYKKSATVLDNKRLGKQRIEAWQIYLSLTRPEYGWKNHPAVKMWFGYHKSLLLYGIAICNEWRNRGFKDTMLERFEHELKLIPLVHDLKPKWIGNKKFHASHRSNLLRKDMTFYGRWRWKEGNNIPYYWPIEEKSNV